jgi:DNA primase
MITQDSISRVIDASVVEEVVGDFVSLKRRGVNLLGLCPFHDEKTPSFTVSPAKGIYKCFGCGKAGNSVGFVMDHEQMGFADSIRYLGKKFNVQVEETENTAEEKEKITKKENWQVVLDYATNYYIQTLNHTEEGKSIGLTYLAERGLTSETIAKWQIGFSKNAWDALHKDALNAGYNEQYLADVGLIKQNEQEKWYDVFRNRVIFPIRTAQGKVVAFGGRILNKDAKAAKYLNSPETELYKKSYTLFGLYHAKSSIRKEDKCYLSEGYLDVISLSQAGIENVVAASGTSFTDGQAKLIKRFTPNVTVLFDGDAAGLKAAFRSIDILLGFGFNVRVVPMPEGEDPDSLCRSMGGRAFKDYLSENEQDFIIYKSKTLIDKSKNDPIAKTEFVKDVLTSVARIKDSIKRAFYVKECASLMEVDEQVVHQELRKILNVKGSTEPSFLEPKAVKQEQSTEHLPLEGIQEQEKAILKMLLLHGHEQISEHKKVVDFILDKLEEDQAIFTHELAKQVLEEYEHSFRENNTLLNSKDFTSKSDQVLVQFIAELISNPYLLSNGWEKNEVKVRTDAYNYTQETLDIIRLYKLKQARNMLNVAQEALKDSEQETELLMEIASIKKVQRELGEKLGNVFNA